MLPSLSVFKVIVRVIEPTSLQTRNDNTVVVALGMQEAISFTVNLLNDVGFDQEVRRRDVISVERLNDPEEMLFFTEAAEDILINSSFLTLPIEAEEDVEEARYGG